ncbi:hypothetical protein GCM10010193_58030 [Kitasatospora atroaurantiaca]|uniref:Uncharacterized protein n=1 Tax=Kitasatospora atroaurantiaca TaxID=285545 RepID=A0A561EHP7_9ACTN|nr:hypothetical protein [Kitasatospora atroaurantiaca]TWE15139.1 hypothetical protein FB465_0009 [Kitasatospora atroaurantiaca]TWE21940.1 hypothetical protein FB465_7197 [Kitasatospora atroaurantiaca]
MGEGVRHQVLLGALAKGGLEVRHLPAAGWEPALLEALDLAARYGRGAYVDEGQAPDGEPPVRTAPG